MSIIKRLGSWIDPFRATSADQPPTTLGRFVRWALRDVRWPLAVLVVASLVVGLSEAAVFGFAGRLVDLASTSGPETFWSDNAIYLALMALLVLVIRPIGMASTAAVTSMVITPGLTPMVVWRLHRHTLGQSLSYFEDDFAGRLSQKEMQTAHAVTQATTETVNSVGYLCAYVIGAAYLMADADPRLALILVVWVGFWLLLLRHSLPRIRASSKARAEARAGVSGQLVDSLTNMLTVKLFAHSAREEAAALGSLQNYRSKALNFGTEIVRFRIGLAIINTLTLGATVVSAVWLWQAGMASVGVIAAAIALVFRATGITGWVSMAALSIFSEIGTLEDGISTLSKPHKILDRPDAPELKCVSGHIRFEDVVFRYGRAKGGVGPLDLDIQAGQKIGLVGRSGAGKSTLIALLLRLYEVESGRVLLDGLDLRDIRQDSLRRQVSVVTQDTAIFNRSALENILYGRPEAGEAAAMDAARRARADGFIRDLRDFRGRAGFEARLGERGVKLSGGQRQRLALARAILKDAPILVLDEATSALDSEVERDIQDELGRLMAGKTVIAIAHRLSTIAAMDRIIVMDDGFVVEDGTHDELLGKGGLYGGFWAHQSGGFICLEEAVVEPAE